MALISLSVSPAKGESLSVATVPWLAALVMLAQMPHYLYLPWWVSLAGATLVVLGVARWRHPDMRWLTLLTNGWSLTLAAAIAVVLIKAHYGYFIGRDPCVAFLFLLVSCKFAESRSIKDATLLICLSAFLLSTRYFYSQSLISGIVTVPAVLAIGGAFYVIRQKKPTSSLTEPLAITGKLLLQGLPIAALLFVIFPRLPGPLWSLPHDSAATTGLSDSMTLGSISELSQSGAVAFRVDFDTPVPNAQSLYWRGPVLSQFDGRTWSQNNLQSLSSQQSLNFLPKSDKRYLLNPDASATPPVTQYTVTLEPHQRHWLFALDVPASLPVNDAGTQARLSHDFQLLSATPVSDTLRYQQTSFLQDRYYDTQPPGRVDGQVSGQVSGPVSGKNQRTHQFARQLRQQYPDDTDLANAMLRWFAEEPYFYTLRPTLAGDNPVDEFLFDSLRGFCEHYAAAFTVVMRAAGIPARIVTGYQGGEMNGEYMIVRQSDAHAWAEVWIDNAWRRYDPTAAVAPSRVEAGIGAALPSDEPLPTLARFDTSWLRAAHLRWDSVNYQWQQWVVDFNTGKQQNLWRKLGFPNPSPLHVALVVIGAAALWSLLLLRGQWSWRPLRRRPPEDRLWERWLRHLQLSGLEKLSHEGPQDLGQRAAKVWPMHQNSILSITSALVTLRYSSPIPVARNRLVTTLKRDLNSLPSPKEWRQSTNHRDNNKATLTLSDLNGHYTDRV